MEQSKTKNIVSWIIQILVAALFVMASLPKLMSQPEVIENFKRWGMPDKIHLLIGAFELLGAIGLLIPRLAGLAAIGLIFIMIGAAFTHLTHNEALASLLPITVIILLAVVAYIRNPLRKG